MSPKHAVPKRTLKTWTVVGYFPSNGWPIVSKIIAVSASKAAHEVKSRDGADGPVKIIEVFEGAQQGQLSLERSNQKNHAGEARA